MANSNSEAYIIDAVRTPRGKGKTTGALYEVKPVQLLSHTLQQLMARQHIHSSVVEDVVIGCVSPIGEQGANIGKSAALLAGWSDQVAGVQINRFCASGLEAINLAAMKIRSGWEDVIVAGGVESMSRVPMGSDGGPWVLDPATQHAARFVPQGISADLIASKYGFSRSQVDAFALQSQQRAIHAQQQGYFSRSIVPVTDASGLSILAQDELPRADTTPDRLAKLSPSFSAMGQMAFDAIALQQFPEVGQIAHVHHAGNSSGIADGAAALLLASAQAVRQHQLKPRAKIIASAVVGSDPTMMLTGPAPAARKALEKAGLSIDDIDLFEVNEAFAAVVLRFMQELNVPIEKVNVNGGAIALGHPLGATGAMLLGTVLDELERQNKRYGLVCLCVGAGMGIATIIERVTGVEA